MELGIGTPAGYRPPEAVTRVPAGLVMTACSLIAVGSLVGVAAFGVVHGVGFAAPSPVVCLLLLVGLVGCHEVLHAVILRLYGYDVSLTITSWRTGSIAIEPRDQLIERRHAIAAMLAPVVGLSLVLLPVVLVGSPAISTAAFVLFWANLVASSNDVSKALHLSQFPRRTLYYSTGPRTFVLEPQAG